MSLDTLGNRVMVVYDSSALEQRLPSFMINQHADLQKGVSDSEVFINPKIARLSRPPGSGTGVETDTCLAGRIDTLKSKNDEDISNLYFNRRAHTVIGGLGGCVGPSATNSFQKAGTLRELIADPISVDVVFNDQDQMDSIGLLELDQTRCCFDKECVELKSGKSKIRKIHPRKPKFVTNRKSNNRICS
ncbi:hypothetical protein RYX36_003737 [Vicia faba]